MPQNTEFVGFWYRLGALIWDLIAFGALAALVIGILLGGHWKEPWAGPMTGQLVFSVLVIYFLGSWILFGRSLGKYLCSQRIVALKTGEKPSAWRLVLRLLTYPTVPISALLMGRDRFRRALHDRVAGTCVVADQSMRPLNDTEQAEVAFRSPEPPWAARA